MNTTKFKAGDKVKVISCSGPRYWYTDKIGEVFTISGPSEFGYYVTERLVGSATYSVKECDIELVDEEWKDGLPQEGTVCELLGTPRGIWGIAEILYISDEVCVWRWQVSGTETFNRISDVSFRHIKTEEEKEAERQKDLICEMLCETNRMSSYTEMAEYLYDAGFRLVKADE